MIRLDDYWYSQNPVAWLLLPLSWLFCVLALLRRLLYRSGVLNSKKISVPVIIVGNISVGGTGKTPLLIALCELLKQHGIQAGIISRGYGGDFSGVKIITDDDKPSTVGDEPCLIKKRTGLPVAVGTDRPAVAKALLEQHQCDLLLSDDGLQHYRLQRDFEIAVIDTNRKFGNGFCLPAGPLRERPGRLRDIDLVAYNATTASDDVQDSNFTLKFGDAVNMVTGETKAVESFSDDTVHAVAGIGNPARFFDQLQAVGITVIEHAFPDHHAYTASDLTFEDNKMVFMTEKDAVKCNAFANERSWYIPVSAALSKQLSGCFIADMSRLVEDSADA